MLTDRCFLTLDAAAEKLGVSPCTVQKWVQSHCVTRYRYGGIVIVNYKDLVRIVDKSPVMMPHH